MRIKQLISICIGSLLFIPASGWAETVGFLVAGSITFTKTGALYCSLVTQKHYENDETSPFNLVLPVGDQERKAKQVAFTFEKVPAGTYAIQCFQDVNGNGTLDQGQFGPKEPWGMYRPKRPLLRGPTFEEIKFDVTSDIVDITFEVK